MLMNPSCINGVTVIVYIRGTPQLPIIRCKACLAEEKQ